MIDGKPAGTVKAGADGKWSLDATLDAWRSPGAGAGARRQRHDCGGICGADYQHQRAGHGDSAPTINAPDGPITSSPFTLGGTGALARSSRSLWMASRPAPSLGPMAPGACRSACLMASTRSARAVDAAGKELAASSPITLTLWQRGQWPAGPHR
ncbi:MAG: hypothetical protein U0Z44_07395 [Kouleothrix sp.]